MSFQQEIDKFIKEKRLYFVGDRLPSDWYEAFKLWHPLAEGGDPKAQYNIGRCYHNGDGIDQDNSKAIEWYMKAAAQGEPRSHFNLHIVFKEELKEGEKASEWLTKAVELGEPRAIAQINSESMNTELQAAKELLVSGIEGKAKAKELFLQLVEKGSTDAEFGLVACDTSIFVEDSRTSHHYSYISNGNTAGGAYANPTIVFKVKNNSNYAAKVTLFISRCDYSNPEKKIGDNRRLQFPLLKTGEMAEIREELSSDPIIVHLVGYNISLEKYEAGSGHKTDEYFELKKKIVAGFVEAPKSSGCFILTACYGDYDAPTVMQYRNFRDKYLDRNQFGRKFISWYYIHGPKWAEIISQMPRTKAALRVFFRFVAGLLPK